MALPGLQINVLDGNLGLLQGSNAQQMLYIGNCLSGAQGVLAAYGDQQTLLAALGGGELLEAAGYGLKVGGGPVYVYPMPLTTRGGVGAVTKLGTGAGTATLSLAPHAQVTVTCTTAGTLGGGAAFTIQIGSGAISAPVTSAASWSSTGYQVPGTYITIVFVAGSYVAGGTPDIYTISALGVIAHPQGAGPAVPSFTASPVDGYNVKIKILTAGAVGTMQFQYTLDGTDANYSGAVLSASGVYQLIVPASGLGTGIVVTFASTFVVGDTYTFAAAGPTFAAADLTAAFTALQTTYLSMAQYAMIAVIGTLGSTAAWSTQAAACESAALTFFNLGVYVRIFGGCPTVGTVLPNAGSITVDAADTDSVVITARQAMSAPHFVPCAGDEALTSPITGLSFRRNALWGAVARASKVEASKNIGAVADGGLTNVTALFRDDGALGGTFDAAGITTVRTFPNYSGFYMTDGRTATVSTSDYFPLTNARVIDRGCAIVRQKGLPYVNAKLPTTTRNGLPGVITEKKAQQIEADVTQGMKVLVDNSPQDAVGVSAVVNRTNNLLATQNLIIAANIQPYAYARTVTVNIGLQITAGS